MNTANTPKAETAIPANCSTVKLPKRLIALLVFLTVTSVSGILAKQGVLFCILTLLMVVSIIGRQKVGLFMLRAYTCVQLLLVSLLPIVIYDPDNLLTNQDSVYTFGQWQSKVPDMVIFALLIFIAMVQVWLAFNHKVKTYFNRSVTMNIMG